MKISVVIPVYNEVESLSACIEALALQTEPLYEVIVVDNNSDDNSKQLAQTFDFVTVISESRQGVSYARDCGFDYASGDIIARIDADSIVPSDYSQKLQSIFSDRMVDAVSGSMVYYDLSFNELASTFDKKLRRIVNKSMSKKTFLQGCNMAVRRSAWKAVFSELCHGKALHEDVDLALHLQTKNYKVIYDESLAVQVSARRYDSDFKNFMNYVLALPRTYGRHGNYNYLPIFLLVVLAVVAYLPARTINRYMGPLPNRFNEPRIDPTSNSVN